MRIKLDDGAYMPERAHDTDAGLDIKSPKRYVLRPLDAVIIDTGVHVELPNGTGGMLKSKSGLNVKDDIVSEGVIDEGYTGSIVVKLYNHGRKLKVIEPGDKISQLVVMPCYYPMLEVVDDLDPTERGDKGFGSTGK